MAVMIITHDLGVIAEVADDVVVAYAGKTVEYADVRTIFKDPRHPYTQALYHSIPRLTDSKKRQLEVISGMVPNPLEFPSGNYLSSMHTVKWMRQEYFRQRLADRQTREAWEKSGALDGRERAWRKAKEIIKTHVPKGIDLKIDHEIRNKFDIRL